MKKILGLVALATLLFASCQKEEGVKVDQTPKAVTINLANVVPATKGMQQPELNTKAALTDFTVFFVQGDKLVKGKTAVITEDENGNVVYTDHKHYYDLTAYDALTDAEKVYHYLEHDVTKVAIVGNLGDLWTDAEDVSLQAGQDVPKTLTDLKKLISEIATNQNCADLPLYGEADITKNIGQDIPGHPLYQADVKLAPIVSRIEIVGFEYAENPKKTAEDVTPVIPARKYTNIEIQQVVFDNYFPLSDLGGAESGTKVYTEITDDNAFNFLNANVPVANWWNALPNVTLAATEDATDVDYAKTYSRAEGNVEKIPAFNFFPGATPQVVVKLVGTDSNGLKTTHYLVAKDFVKEDTDADDASLITANANTIYKVKFVFDDDDLEDPLKCVLVTVDVTAWTVVEVVPEF